MAFVRASAAADTDIHKQPERPEAFQAALTSSVPLIDFYLRQTLAGSRTDGLERKTRLVRDLAPLLARIPGQVRRSEYIRKVAAMLDIREEALERDVLGQTKPTRPAPATSRRRRPPGSHTSSLPAPRPPPSTPRPRRAPSANR